MSRRVRVPAADDLFRPTVVPDAPSEQPLDQPSGPSSDQPPDEASDQGSGKEGGLQAEQSSEPVAPEPEVPEAGLRQPSGRVRHDEKMTVYVTADELLDLEHARLALRRDHGLGVDRGRLVRQAVAIALADLEENGENSLIVSRLTQS